MSDVDDCREEKVYLEIEIRKLKQQATRMAKLLLECRDALPAISQASAKLRGVDLTLADRIEVELEPWRIS